MLDLNSSEARQLELRAIRWKVNADWLSRENLLDMPEADALVTRREALLTSSPDKRYECVLAYAEHVKDSDLKEFSLASSYIAAAMAEQQKRDR